MTTKYRITTQRAGCCSVCDQKRRTAQYKSNSYQTNRARWQLCAPCLLESLQILLAKNLKRSKPT